MPTETPAQYRARLATNASKSNTVAPIQRGPVQNPANKPLVLPKVTSVPFTGKSGVPQRGR
jgi:hypothetical protein